ncbi:MAG: nucleotidyltransferase domain-containing protein [bacterium]
MNFLFKNPDKECYLREIARNLNKEPSYIQNSVNTLVSDGILKDERKGNLRFFKLNKEHILYNELKNIISKTLGLEHKLKELVNSLEGVESAFIFGSIASNKEDSESDIDLIIIGSVNQDQLIDNITKLELELNREINYHLYGKEEVIDKINKQSDFIIKIFNEPKIILKGNLDEFTELTKFNSSK